MNDYNIKLKKNNETYSENFSAISFPEAASRAYRIRSHKGYDWEITSVKKNNEKSTEDE